MDHYEVKELAQLALSEARFTTASGFARANCPFCLERVGKDDRKACFAVDTKTGFFKCWRCGVRGKLDDVGDPDAEVLASAPKEASVVEPPEGFMELGVEPGKSAICTEDARAYLHSRGFHDPALWAAAKIGCCVDGRFGGRVVVPVLGVEGLWLGWVARAWVKRSERPYMNAPGMTFGTAGNLYNEAALGRDEGSPVMVMEGVFDALSYWPDAVAVLGKPTNEQVRTLIKSARPVVMVLDGDAWEEAWAITMRMRFDGQRAGFVKLPPRIDPDEVDHSWLREEAERSLEAEL